MVSHVLASVGIYWALCTYSAVPLRRSTYRGGGRREYIYGAGIDGIPGVSRGCRGGAFKYIWVLVLQHVYSAMIDQWTRGEIVVMITKKQIKY